MISSLHNVHDNFYRLFAGAGLADPVIRVTTHRGVDISCKVTFAKKSATNYAEIDKLIKDNSTIYPVMTILPYTPTLIREKYFQTKDRISGLNTPNPQGNPTKGRIYPDPLPLRFRYDVSIAASSESDWDALIGWMYKNFDFDHTNTFVFNKIILPLDDQIGDYVTYTVEITDPPRPDGIFETLFSFTLEPFCHIKEPTEVELVQSVNFTLEQQTP